MQFSDMKFAVDLRSIEVVQTILNQQFGIDLGNTNMFVLVLLLMLFVFICVLQQNKNAILIK